MFWYQGAIVRNLKVQRSISTNIPLLIAQCVVLGYLKYENYTL
jgi:hypothetical protein